MKPRPVRWRYPAASDIKRIGKNRFARGYGILFASTEANNISQIGENMGQLKKRIERIEARIIDRRHEKETAEICEWFAGAVATLDAGGTLAPDDQELYDEIIREIDAMKAKEGRL